MVSPVEVTDLAKISLSGVYLGQMAVVVPGVLAVTPEYETTMIRTTLAAHPVRPAVLAAKAANIAAIVLIAGTVSVLGSLVATRMIRPNSVSLVDGSTLRAYAGTVLYCRAEAEQPDQSQVTRDVASQPIAPWAGIGVLTAWTGAALALGAVLFSRRDA